MKTSEHPIKKWGALVAALFVIFLLGCFQAHIMFTAAVNKPPSCCEENSTRIDKAEESITDLGYKIKACISGASIASDLLKDEGVTMRLHRMTTDHAIKRLTNEVNDLRDQLKSTRSALYRLTCPNGVCR